MTANTEIETKVLADSETTLDEIAALYRIGNYRLAEPRTQHLQTTYLDTDNLTLTRNRFSLRTRCADGAWEMTAKWDGVIHADAHERAEINIPLEAEPLLPICLPREVAEHVRPLVRQTPLRPLVVTHIVRRTRNVYDGPLLLAELALDVVRNSAPDSATKHPAYYEVEIELRDGPRSALAQIAALFLHNYELRPTHSSKFSRAIEQVLGIDRDLLRTDSAPLESEK